MIRIPDLRTARFIATVQELPMINSIELLHIPDHQHEKATTALIKAITSEIQGQVDNPLHMTVQERMMFVAHYLVGLQEGDPDFQIGENKKLSDFLIGDQQYKLDEIDLGIHDDDQWTAKPLIGVMVETIEAISGEFKTLSDKEHWKIGIMAAQLIPNGDELDHSGGDYDKQLYERMCNIASLPESSFINLYILLEQANQKFKHLFNITVTDHGIVATAMQAEEDGTLPVARFPVISCISEFTVRVFGEHELSSS